MCKKVVGFVKRSSVFSAATMAHIKLEDKLEVAALRHAPAEVVGLRVAVANAANARALARESLVQHELLAHGGATPIAT